MSNTNKRALLEASSAVAASLFATLSAYPIDVLSTNIQNKQTKSESDNKNGSSYNADDDKTHIFKERNLKSLLRGIHMRVAQVVVQSFSFFYFFSRVKIAHEHYTLKKGIQQHDKPAFKYNPSITVKLLLSALSAAMAVLLSLPLETIAARLQVEKDSDTISITQHDDTSDVNDSISSTSSETSVQIECSSSSKEEEEEEEEAEFKPHTQPRTQQEADSDDDAIIRKIECLMPHQCIVQKKHSSFKEKFLKFRQLWSGLVPSLILTSNPAINFTTYDCLKESLLRYKRRQNQICRITSLEAFILGMIAKFTAIVATYPLIRTKTILMVAKRKEYHEDGSLEQDNLSALSVLREMYAEGGIRELYKGCGLTMFHIMFKSSLFMMAKDKISGQ